MSNNDFVDSVYALPSPLESRSIVAVEPDAVDARITLKDVAQRVGVAVSTVSKVVNDRPDVGPEVRQRVLEAIETMGFRPNTIARGLRTHRSDTIAIVTD